MSRRSRVQKKAKAQTATPYVLCIMYGDKSPVVGRKFGIKGCRESRDNSYNLAIQNGGIIPVL